MEDLKYKVIKNKMEYDKYCAVLEELLGLPQTKAIGDEVELLTVLIEKWDAENNTFSDIDPVELLKSFMKDHSIKSKDLAELLQVSKGYVSDILHYKKGLSKDVIRKLADRFKVTQELFNRPYKLHVPENMHLRNASVMNTRKELEIA